MPVVAYNPPGLFPPYQNYSHAVEIEGGARLLIISGLNGYLADGVTLPESFEEQGALIWDYIGALLQSAGMTYEHLVSLRIYLAHPSYDEANVRLRRAYLGDHRSALTVVCCQLLDPRWKLEIEAIAASTVASNT
jgi:2-iminobutanoate/2-iminopropanoate deaminase